MLSFTLLTWFDYKIWFIILTGKDNEKKNFLLLLSDTEDTSY